MALEITDVSIDEVLENGGITMIDFHAAWCGPCRMLGPIVETLSTDNQENDKVTIGKMDVDANSSTAAKYGVRNIPTVLFFKNGELVDRVVGVQGKNAYQDRINVLISDEANDNSEK